VKNKDKGLLRLANNTAGSDRKGGCVVKRCSVTRICPAGNLNMQPNPQEIWPPEPESRGADVPPESSPSYTIPIYQFHSSYIIIPTTFWHLVSFRRQKVETPESRGASVYFHLHAQ
jgi:hypothetical protein